jgi:TRAP-type C4-dicarboxylate transport system permease large subunit
VPGLICGIFTPTEAAGIGVALALFFGLVMSRDVTAVPPPFCEWLVLSAAHQA